MTKIASHYPFNIKLYNFFATLQILLPAIFVCIAMGVSKIRPSIVMPALELTTDMFLNEEPNVHYLPFSFDNSSEALTENMTHMLVKYPGVGKKTICL